MSGYNNDITPAVARPVYDEQIDEKGDEKDIHINPVVHHLDGTEVEHAKQ